MTIDRTPDVLPSRRDRVTDIKVSPEVLEAAGKLARKRRTTVAGLVREAMMPLVIQAPLPGLPDSELETFLAGHPDAITYTAPGAMIVAAAADDGSYAGLIFDPARAGTLAAWTSQDAQAPLWARRPSIARALAAVASRVDEGDGTSYFRVPGSKYVVLARWGGSRWDDGVVVDLGGGAAATRERWLRGTSSAVMEAGSKAGRMPNVRRVLTLLCTGRVERGTEKAATIAGGGKP